MHEWRLLSAQAVRAYDHEPVALVPFDCSRASRDSFRMFNWVGRASRSESVHV